MRCGCLGSPWSCLLISINPPPCEQRALRLTGGTGEAGSAESAPFERGNRRGWLSLGTCVVGDKTRDRAPGAKRLDFGLCPALSGYAETPKGFHLKPVGFRPRGTGVGYGLGIPGGGKATRPLGTMERRSCGSGEFPGGLCAAESERPQFTQGNAQKGKARREKMFLHGSVSQWREYWSLFDVTESDTGEGRHSAVWEPRRGTRTPRSARRANRWFFCSLDASFPRSAFSGRREARPPGFRKPSRSGAISTR